MGPEIRPAATDDTAAIAEVHVASWRSAYRGMVDDPYLDALAPASRLEQWRSRLASPPPRGVLLVAADAGAIVGFLEAGSAAGSTAADHDPAVGELHALYLLPAWWGRGVGTRLLDGGLDRLAAHGFDRAILWVLDANRSARAFYERRGWVHDGASDVYEIGDRTYPIVRYARAL